MSLPEDTSSRLVQSRSRSGIRLGDRVLGGGAQGAGILVLILMASIGLFLFLRAIPGVRADTVNPLFEKTWSPDAAKPVWGIVALAWGTAVTSLIALVIAVPVAIGIALFIAHYAPRGLAIILGALVDLLAAIPSVVYGLWGLQWLVGNIMTTHQWLNHRLGWIPIFGGTVLNGKTLFTAGVILAIMILPIIAAVSREVFLQVPRDNIEAALALGATRWEVMRLSVLPFGKAGVISATMLGLGRALGETIAIALVLSTSFETPIHILQPGGITFAANIPLKFNESAANGRSALIASGFVLFLVTLAVNMAARAIIARRSEFVAG